MPEDTKEIKAKKLAAARKKLKEYQEKEKRNENSNVQEQKENMSSETSAAISEMADSEINSNGYEKVDTDNAAPPFEIPTESIAVTNVDVIEISLPPSFEVAENPFTNSGADASAYSNTACTSATTTNSSSPRNNEEEQEENKLHSNAEKALLVQSDPNNLDVMQILIAEKSQLNTELHKCRTSCREKDMENEELRTQLTAFSRRFDDLQKRFLEQQNILETYRLSNEELKQQQIQSQAENTERLAHLKELQQQLQKLQSENMKFEQLYKEKCNELELAQIRINQLSDETCITKDMHVENLTQKQFMYEQQIRDLQAMVQQLTEDNNQADIQYQNYTKHLSAEVTNLNEKNSELSDENTKLKEREDQLVQHISDLEREIQKNLLRRDHREHERSDVREEIQIFSERSNKQLELEKQITNLNEKISELEFERHEFQLKIKSQEDRLEDFIKDLQQKQQLIEDLQEHLQTVNSEQPDKVRLLAAIESDKIAASRAVAQNIELKKQLDELELRFIQLTNDKADLINKLDSAQFTNREMTVTYKEMDEKLHNINERLKFKDEEMIRLSHENMDLKRTNLIMKQQLDRLKHYEVNEYSKHYKKSSRTVINQKQNDITDPEVSVKSEDPLLHGHEHDCNQRHDCEKYHDGNQEHVHDQGHHHDCHQENGDGHPYNGDGHPYDCKHNCDSETEIKNEHDLEEEHRGNDEEHFDQDHENQKYDYHKHEKLDQEHNNEDLVFDITDSCYSHENNPRTESETTMSCQEANEDLHIDHNDHYNYTRQEKVSIIPTAEAVEKLQQRFTKLMSQVADLTEEKQRLEHLVLQLQGETETIGEYITLYQTQRRVLKQREYEKAAQMKLLQAEREQMKQRITILNNLVSSLSQQVPNFSIPRSLEEQKEFNSPEASNSESVATTFEQSNTVEPLQQRNISNQEPRKLEPLFTDSHEILTKIQSIISEIKENTNEIPTVRTTTVDHLNCCLGKFEVI